MAYYCQTTLFTYISNHAVYGILELTRDVNDMSGLLQHVNACEDAHLPRNKNWSGLRAQG